MHSTEGPETYNPGEMTLSKLAFYSVAVVASNKALKSFYVEAVPMEDFPLLDGELDDEKQSYEASAQDASGSIYSKKLDTSMSVKAKWLPLGSHNRRTAPDVRRGEVIMLYRFGELDKYFWTTYHDDIHLRKLETVIYAWSATTKESDKATSDTTYYFEISTHTGLVHFHTSDVNGEYCKYDIQINTKEGVLAIADSIGNYVQMDSRARRLELKNADGSHFDLNRKQLTITTGDSVIVNTKVSQVNCTSATISASSETNIDSPSTKISGTLEVGGRTTLKGGFDAGGGGGGTSSIAGGLGVTGGDVNVAGNVNANNIP